MPETTTTAPSVKDQVNGQLNAGASAAFAEQLKTNWNTFKYIFKQTGSEQLPDAPKTDTTAFDNQIKAYAHDFTVSGKAVMTFVDGSQREVSLGELDERISKLPEGPKNIIHQRFKDALGSESLEDGLASTSNAFQKIASITQDVTDNQSSWINKLMIGLKAIFIYLGSMLFGDGERISFKEAMAQAAAPSIINPLRERLGAEAEKDPNLKRILATNSSNGTTLDQVCSGVIRGTYEYVGAPLPRFIKPPAAAPDLSTVTVSTQEIPTPTEARNLIITKVKEANLEATITQKIQEAVATQIADNKKALKANPWMPNWAADATVYCGALVKAPNVEEVTKASRELSSVLPQMLADAVLDPNLKSTDGSPLSITNKDAFSTAIAQKVTSDLTAKAREFGANGKIHTNIAAGIADPKNQKEIYNAIYAQVSENFNNLRDARMVAVTSPAQQLGASADVVSCIKPETSEQPTETAIVSSNPSIKYNPDGRNNGDTLGRINTIGNQLIDKQPSVILT